MFEFNKNYTLKNVNFQSSRNIESFTYEICIFLNKQATF